MIKIENKTGKVVVRIDGRIGESWFKEGNTAENIIKQIKGIDKDTPIWVHISGLGGDAHEGLKIFDLFTSISNHIIIYPHGASASATTIVMMAGDEINAAPNSWFLIHNASTGGGNKEQLKAKIEMLTEMDKKIVDIYTTNNDKKTRKDFEELMAQDKWISAEQALEYGLIHKIVKGKGTGDSLLQNQITEINNSSTLPPLASGEHKTNNRMAEKEDGYKAGVAETIANFMSFFGKNKDPKDTSIKNAAELNLTNLQNTADELTTLNNSLTSEKETLTNELQNSKDLVEAKKTEIETYKNEIKTLKNEKETLKTKVASLSEPDGTKTPKNEEDKTLTDKNVKIDNEATATDFFNRFKKEEK